MKSAALELGEYKITVNAVIPGLIDTPPTRHRQRYEQAVDNLQPSASTTALETEARKRLLAKTPLGVPWLEPEAIAPVVLFLASDEAYMVSGASYDVTGGEQRQLQRLAARTAAKALGPPLPRARDSFVVLLRN